MYANPTVTKCAPSAVNATYFNRGMFNCKVTRDQVYKLGALSHYLSRGLLLIFLRSLTNILFDSSLLFGSKSSVCHLTFAWMLPVLRLLCLCLYSYLMIHYFTLFACQGFGCHHRGTTEGWDIRVSHSEIPKPLLKGCLFILGTSCILCLWGVLHVYHCPPKRKSERICIYKLTVLYGGWWLFAN